MRSIAAMAAVALALPVSACGQEETACPTPSEAHEAAVELVEASEMKTIFESSMDQMIEAQLSGNPRLSQMEGVFRDFFDKYMSWEQMRCEYVDLYAERFTAGELRELEEFYSTDVGKKAVRVTPELMRAAMEAGQERVQEHLPELRKKIQEQMQQGSGSGTPRQP